MSSLIGILKTGCLAVGSHREKACLWDFQPGPSQNWLYNHKKAARGFKFQIYEVEGLYYRCSENKGYDLLHGNCAADVCLCFCL